MKWTLGKKLVGLSSILVAVSLGASAWVFSAFYRQDKLQGVLAGEITQVRQVAGTVENLLRLASFIDLDRVSESREIIFVLEDPCDPNPRNHRVAVSSLFQRQLTDLGMLPRDWAQSLDVHESCVQQMGLGPRRPTIFPGTLPLMVPYVTAMVPTPRGFRLALFSLDGFSGGADSSMLMVDNNSKLLWAGDGAAYLKTVFEDTGVSQEILSWLSKRGVEDPGSANAFFVGTDGILAYSAPVSNRVLAALSYRPSVMRPVSFVTEQVVTLALGFLFLTLFLAKRLTAVIIRPLSRIQEAADTIAKGDFSGRFQVTGEDEIATLQTAFNHMSERISNLVEETKVKAGLESELAIAQKVQMMLMPPGQVKVAGHEIHAWIRSASQVGGDWWNMVEIPRDGAEPCVLILVGDATDHGAASALITAVVRGAFAAYEDLCRGDPARMLDPRESLRVLNEAIFCASRGSITMSFFAVVADPQNNQLVFHNAGHCFPYLLLPGQAQPKALGTSGESLGHKHGIEFPECGTHAWPPGAQLFLYSDGLVENMKGEVNVFDRRSLRKAIQAASKQRGKGLLAGVIQAWEKLSKDIEQADDVTAVVVRRDG